MPIRPTPLALLPAAARNAARRFAKDEHGSLMILSLQILLVMLICTGIAIDFVRQEERRTLIQNTIDRAALASASLRQTLDPRTVALDYLAKAGLADLSADPIVTEGLHQEWRRVEISVKDTMGTMFGPLLGINSLTASAATTAEESIGNVEISLVLDISGSMNDSVWVSGSKRKKVYSTRLDLLKPAAQNFVKTMFDMVQPADAPPGRLSVSIVPYNQQVVLGDDLAAAYTLSADTSGGTKLRTCVDLHDADFTSTVIDPDTTLQRTMFGDSFDFFGRNYRVNTYTWLENCDERNDETGVYQGYADVLAFSNDYQKLYNKIENLKADGNTAIDFGAKWGVALLDPKTQPVLNKLKSNSLVSPDLSGRPFKYATDKTATDISMKVLVLMTDGMNTLSYSTKLPYRTGPSGLKSKKSATSIGEVNVSWYGDVIKDDTYKALYYYEPGHYPPYYSFATDSWVNYSGTLYDITYDTLWKTKGFTLQYVLQYYLGVPHNNAYTLYQQMALQSEGTDKDTNLSRICAAAKAEGVTVFTIGVDAPSGVDGLLSGCATKRTAYYDVTSNELTTAFASIAASINALRLTN
ncbi:MAG: Tad domain-containing protein [Paracoccaceae bacterium]|nr:Tad domain-containing protein [Paracoccaceae bacterium]